MRVRKSNVRQCNAKTDSLLYCMADEGDNGLQNEGSGVGEYYGTTYISQWLSYIKLHRD